MKSKPLPLVLILVLLAGVLLPAGPLALAHPVSVDANPADWTMVPPTQVNLGHIGRNAAEEGEYVWRDQGVDERTDFSTPDPRVDLLQFRVTADPLYLYFMAEVSDTAVMSGDGAPMVQVAIDVDRVQGSGQTWLGGFADTQVSPSAAWERLVITRFGSGTPAPKVFDTTWTDLVNGDTNLATNVISSTTDVIEMRVRWDVLGLAGPPELPLRFTVATFRANTSDDTWDTGGSGTSNALDCVTNYGDPGLQTNTWTEVSDQFVDYFFDLWFEADGDVFPPLLVSEFQPNPPGTDANREWIEIYNSTPFPLSLDAVKVGDEETIGAGESMFLFPDGYSIPANGVIILAARADTGTDGFWWLYGFCPDFETIDTTGPNCNAPNTSLYGTWATNNNLALSNSGDEVIVLDRSDTVLDVAAYGAGVWPGVTTLPWTDSANSIERLPVYHDSNDCVVDFRLQPNPTPGQAWPDLAIAKAGPDLAMPGSYITYTVVYSNTGVNRAHNVVIADLLPTGVFYVGDDSGLACPACVPGATGVLTWSVGVVGVADTGSFDLVGWVTATVPFGSVFTNSVSIATTDNEVSLDNNSDDWATAVTALDLIVDKAGPAYGIAGQNLVYDITLQAVGVDPAENVVLTDVLPLDVTYLADNSGWTCPACTPGSAGPLVWTVGTVPAGTSYTFQLTVTAAAGIANGTTLTNTVVAQTTTAGDNPANNSADWGTTFYPLVSIYDIQYVPDPGSNDLSPYDGQTVWVRGGVVAGYYSGSVRGYALADPEAPYGPWQGLFVYDYDHTPAEGQVLLLLGEVYEYFHLTELHYIDSYAVISDSWPLPDPVLTTTAAISDITPHAAEALESVMVEVRCATVTAPNLGYGEWGITDASGVQARVDDVGYAYSPVLGETFAYVRGMLYYSFDDYKLEPRYAADLGGGVPVVLGTDPAGGATGVPIDTAVQATFSVSLTASTVNTATFFLEGPGGAAVPADVSYDEGTYTALLDPAADLAYATTYTATLTTDIVSYWGAPLCEEYAWSFTTTARPEPNLTPSFKIASVPAVLPGEVLTYTIRLINVGQGDAAATITDVVPLEVDVVTATLPAYWSYTAGQLLWSGVVTAGTQVPLVFQARAHTDLVGGEFFTNVVWIDDGVHDAFQKTAAVEVLAAPDIVVSPLALSAMVDPGGSATRLLTIANVGDADLEWSLAENPAADWLAEDPGGGTIAPAGSTVVTVSFDATGLDVGTYTTALEVLSDDPDEPLVGVDVTLVVTTGCIPISNPDFTWVPPAPLVGQPVTFYGSAEGLEPITFTWSFGDGGGGSGATVAHTFAVSATYTVVMTATNACGWDVATHLVTVTAPPQQFWTVYLPIVCRGAGR